MITAVRTPESVAAAVNHAVSGGRFLAGGTVVMAQVNYGTAGTTELISLRRAGVAGIEVIDGQARIGATTTLAEVEEHRDLAFLKPAVRTIASPTIRNLATVGGNLFVPQPYGDFAVCLLALDATIELAGPDGPYETPMRDFAGTSDLVTAVRFGLPAAGTWFHHKAMRRRLNSAAIVAVAAVVELSSGSPGGIVTSARIALGGVAPRPVRAVSAEQVLVGRALSADVLEEAGRAARADIAPVDDAYASAWYRSRVLPVHLRRAFISRLPGPPARAAADRLS